jgi:rod shape-determining protein MreD
MRLALALTVFGGGMAQAVLAPALRVADVAPDIPLIVLLLLALRRGPEFGCVAGFLTGLLQDLATGGLVGVQALTKAVVGFALGALGARVRVTQPLVQVPALVVLTLAEGIGRFGLMKLFRFPAPFAELMEYAVVPQAIYNGFVGAAVVFALVWAESFRENAS